MICWQDSYGDTVLHDAIAKDFADIVELLINFREVDLSIKNKRGFNCLHHAALKGNIRSVQIHDTVTNCMYVWILRRGWAPGRKAAATTPFYKRVMERVGGEVDLSIKNKRGFNCLHHAALKTNMPCEVVGSLFGWDVKLNSLNWFYLKSMEIRKENLLLTLHRFVLLTYRAASLIVRKSPDLLNVVKDDGFSALHLASLNGHHSVVECLIKVQLHEYVHTI